VILEIVPEREISEHLKERVMPSGIPDVVEIIVLAPGADAFLACNRAGIGPRLRTSENVLELNHARVSKQQRRVVMRNEGRRRHRFVAISTEVIEKRRANVINAGHTLPVPSRPLAPPVNSYVTMQEPVLLALAVGESPALRLAREPAKKNARALLPARQIGESQSCVATR